MTEPVAKRCVTNRIDRCGVSFRTIGDSPSMIGFLTRLLNCHLEWRMRHPERREVHPVLRSCEPSGFRQTIVKRGGWKRRELTKDRQTWRPRVDLFDRAIGDADCVVVHAK